MTAYFCLFILFTFFVATRSSTKCKYHYTKRIMKFIHKHKFPNNTINIIETIANLSRATGESRLYLADCLGILNDENREFFRGVF